MGSSSCVAVDGLCLEHRARLESARPTWSSSPHPPAEGFAACVPLLPFSRRSSCLTRAARQDLRLSRTVIGVPDQPGAPYVGRFACDWHRLTAPPPRNPGAPVRRNHG